MYVFVRTLCVCVCVCVCVRERGMGARVKNNEFCIAPSRGRKWGGGGRLHFSDQHPAP